MSWIAPNGCWRRNSKRLRRDPRLVASERHAAVARGRRSTMRLDGKTALVTGAGSGIGKCIAETYAREGARVALADINADAAKSAARAIGNNAIALRCDVSKKADVDGVVEETLAAFGALDILVNNAGATHLNKPVLEISEAEYDRIFAVNV